MSAIVRACSLLALIAIAGRVAVAEPKPTDAPPAKHDGPRVFVLDASLLRAMRQRIRDTDHRLAPAVDQLQQSAQAALSAGPFSVVDKDVTPPSGDKHDYISWAPYWWPNPNTPDGLPYVRRDGERNPEIYQLRNRLDLGTMVDTVETLALAYFFTGDEKYAKRATQLIRAWYLDQSTRMNPNFKYAQAVRGINMGRGAGLIESRAFARIVDSVGLLADSDAWTDADERGLTEWFAKFLAWMLDSEQGRDEAAADNNHGTYYDVQIATFAFYAGKPDVARNVLHAVGRKRIAEQIEPDGRQPQELERTKAWSYSVGNLAGLMTLARLGEHVGVDLWHFHTDDGRRIRAALDFLSPYGVGEKEWPYPQINGFSGELLYPLLRTAAVKYPDGPYSALVDKLPLLEPANRGHLLFSPLDPIGQLHVR